MNSPAQAAAQAAADANYQQTRKEAIVIGGAAVCLAALIGGTKPDIDEAFQLVEEFLAKAEKRLGGRIPFER